jgi:murein DD-endopeptidase MepM/ murein hydrolase activator NlpD
MTRKPDPLHNLADALSEDIVAAPADALVHDAAGEPGGADALVGSFDRIAARAAAQSRRRRIVARLRALAHVPAKWTPVRRQEHAQIQKSAWPAPIGWTSAMAGVAGIFVMVIAGGLYLHQPDAYQPAAAPPPVVADQLAPKPAPARDTGPASRAEDRPALTDRAARTDHAAVEPAPAAAPPVAAAAAVPPPAPAAAAGVADEPRRARTVEVRPDAAAPAAAFRKPQQAAPRPPPTEDRLAVLAKTEEQKRSSTPSPAPRAAPAASSYAPAAPARSAAMGGLADAPPGFQWPLRGRVIAGFGSSVGGAANNGIDLAVPAGTDIRAAEDGVVLYAGNEIKGLGNLLLLRHRDGFLTAYAHAQSFAVKPGDTVRRGQVIAKSGESGAVRRPQLHFEIRKDNAPVDPAQYLPPHG